MTGGSHPAPSLERYRVLIEGFTETALRGYLESLNGPNQTRQPKEFNDPVWGTITFEPHEAVILDSPLIQRLRRIRQLGVVHYVYPGANHTRFEHSLGVSHQVGQLAASLNAHEASNVLDDSWVDTLRLAGLCHDIGHGLMSHVVENALSGDEETDDLVLAFQRHTRRATPPQLSEMAAYYMMRSPAVAELFESAYAHSPIRKFQADQPGIIANMIIGLKVDDRYPLIHELISGPFDADKLDYMPRDATMCGVPVVTDVVRLIQKVRSVAISSDQLPKELRGVRTLPDGHILTGVARSGASALDEVSLSRSLMFDKIYRHHKVRAVEAMVTAVVANVGELLTEWTPLLPLTFNDETFLDLSLEDLRARNLEGKADDAQLASAAELLARLRYRRLFVRSFAFAQTMPFDAYQGDPDARLANETFIREISDQPDRREKFLDEIVTQLVTIAEKLGRQAQVEALPGGVRTYIRVDPPTSSGRGSESDQSRAFLIEDKRVFKVEKVRAEGRGWSDAYVNTKDVGYVFAPREIADMVHIAAEVSARLLYQVRVPQEMRAYAKLGGEAMDATRRQLDTHGYYDRLPRDLRPAPLFLLDAATDMEIKGTMERLQGYMGPTQDKATPSLNPQRIRDWITQFSDEVAPLALKVAAGVQMLTREDANKSLEAFFRTNTDFAGARIVPLGEPKDGSSIHTYHLGDITAELGVELSSLDTALLENEPIIFVDDIIGRGSSAISIFEAMLGVAPSQPLDEERPPALSAKAQESLRGRRIAVVATTGFDDGLRELEERLGELGLDATVFAMLSAADLPTVEKVLQDEPSELREAFIAEARRIGLAVLDDGNDRHDIAWREARALGYGNMGVLVVSSYNTPTICLTALWSAGSVEQVEWRPLFPRRKKR